MLPRSTVQVSQLDEQANHESELLCEALLQSGMLPDPVSTPVLSFRRQIETANVCRTTCIDCRKLPKSSSDTASWLGLTSYQRIAVAVQCSNELHE
ncbi:hypothetical protein PHSY_004003 [Pseudozyma hubeiensis SY62]|uniref:Uncharacterized protein n=1 Tax=Pseudozyma hubeiensis (strain SY62) TaxID=1305764 RepID=R9P4R3_PSEHS|nr:hypothetical protein PHSY_004003 [Pseudozyma hubeiensis SY62]GAC96423.1 hypothetical protein PHSY_004003 [Pseudozyma hubeiensis SY62]